MNSLRQFFGRVIAPDPIRTTACLAAVVLLLPLVGCLHTRQGFEELAVEYSEPDENGDSYVTAETTTTVIDKTRVPPFRSTASTDHLFKYTSDGLKWDLTVSTQDYLEGGDIAAFMAELQGVLSELRAIAELFHPATAVTGGLLDAVPPLEELSNGNGND